MNQQNAKEFLPLIQAMAEGKTIQFFDGEEWDDLDDHDFAYEPEVYRIKSEPRTFEMWLYHPMGRMYPFVEGESFTENDEWERITVQEVLK